MVEVGNNVVDVLGANRQTNGCRCDVLLLKLFRRHLRVCSGVWVYYEALHVGHIGKQREYLERVDESPSSLFATLYFEGKDASASVGIVFLVESVCPSS